METQRSAIANIARQAPLHRPQSRCAREYHDHVSHP
jgi:hypothetical protein